MKMTRLASPSILVALALAGALLFGSQTHSHAQADVVWMATNKVWKYYQEGNEPPEDGADTWRDPDYDDSSWASGAAQLGFNEGDEETLLTRGPITFYFRTTINVTEEQLNTANQLVISLIRDDGAVIYINGEEVRRDNMPGEIGDEVPYDTLAVSGVAGSEEGEYFPTNHLSEFWLEVGENTIAVEIHQNSSGSSDVSFQMGMEGYAVIPVLGRWVPPVGIKFEQAAAGTCDYSILDEDVFIPFELGWTANCSGLQSFVAENLSLAGGPVDGFTEGQCMVVTKGSVKLVTDLTDTNSFDLIDVGLDAYRVNISNFKDVAVQFDLRTYTESPSGLMQASDSAKVKVRTSIDGSSFDEELVFESVGGAPNTDIETIFDDGAMKKVTVPTGPIAGWQSVGFNDASWISGVSGAGYERSSSNTYDPFIGPTLELEGQLYGKNPTLYMRVPFDVPDKSIYTGLNLFVRYDDGFVAYLNGVKVAEANAPATPQWNSEATANNPDTAAVVFEVIDISSHVNELRDGANVLAIQGLNQPSTSSDMLTAVELKGLKPGAGGGISLSEIAGPLDGPFRTFRYDVADTARTVSLEFDMRANSGNNAIFLDNILFTGTPLSINSYSSWIQLTTPYDLDGEGDINADPEGDTLKNLVEYAFGGSATEPDTSEALMLPSTEIREIDGQQRFVMTWRQINETATGAFGPFEDEDGFTFFPGGYKVRDITYIPEFSTDGIEWQGGDDGFQVAVLVDYDGTPLPDGPLPEAEGEFLEVSAYWFSDSPLEDFDRVFGRVRIVVDTQ